MKNIIFVCLGNICRSPSAEAVMKKLVETEGFDGQITVDSAGTIGYHEGEPSDPRMKKFAERRGYILNHTAKKFNPGIDFINNDYIITMDNENYSDVISLDKEKKFRHKIFKMSDFARELKFDEVPDPYYGGPDGFENVLDILEDACKGLLEKIKNDLEARQ
jgi:protein-tyrosine phosphatase